MARYLQTKSGLIVPDTLVYAQDDPRARPAMREVATTRDGRDITRGFIDLMQLLQPQDEVLRLRGQGNLEIYREVLRDDQVMSVLAQRRLAVISKEWEITPGGTRRADKKAADFLKEQLEAIRFDNATDKMLYGVFYGYAVAEPIYARDGANVVIDELRVRDRRRFGYGGKMDLRLLTTSNPNPGEELPPRKFWHYATGADHDDEPYGLGLAHWLYWPVLFKRGGLKFWMIFLEKFGAPTTKGTYPANATPEEKTRLLAALEAIATDAGVIIPEGMEIELIEAARTGSVDYDALQNRMNAAIAKVVLGQTLTTEAAGGQYKAEVQMDVRQDLVKADSDLVCESFNRSLVRWLTQWNYPGATPPRVFRRIDEVDRKAQAETDKVIYGIGFKPSLKYVQETYGGEWEEKAPPPALEPPPGTDPNRAPQIDPNRPGAEFAEGPEDDNPEVQAARLDREAAPAVDALIDRIREAVESATSLEQLRDALDRLAPELDEQAFAAMMQNALALAAAAGRFEVLREAGMLEDEDVE